MYGNVVQFVRNINLYFRYVSGNLESSETARRHTARESYVSVAYHIEDGAFKLFKCTFLGFNL